MKHFLLAPMLAVCMLSVSHFAQAQTAVFINEIDYDQPGTDNAEFIELKNTGTTTANLGAYEVVLVNGSNNSIYKTIALPDVSLAPGAYYVISANAATVPNTDLDVSPDENLIQNGAPDAVALRLTATAEIVDAVSYEGIVPGFSEGGSAPEDNSEEGMSLSRTPDGTDTNDNSHDFALLTSTPGEENTTETDPGEPMLTLIHDIQGSGAASPLAGQAVTIEGIVVGDFQEGDGDAFDSDLDGFYVQEESSDWDGLAETSEGIFVYAPDAEDVQNGQWVRLTGTVAEFRDLTEITNVTALETSSMTLVPDTTDVLLPVASRDMLERYEGMLVRFPQELVISEYFNFDRFGEIVLALPLGDLERPYQPTSYVEPGPAAAEIQEANTLSRITLDDARTVQNPDPARHPDGEEFDLDNRFRGGDIVENTVGILDERFGLYRVQPTQAANYIQTNPRTASPEDVGGTLKVASFNVLNYFTTFGSRGADNLTEFERQRAKIIAAISTINADIVGLIEIENNTEAIQNLVSGLNEVMGVGTYDYINTGVIGTDAIKVAFIYKPATVLPVGDYAILTSETDPRFIDTKNRPALAQTFQEIATGGVFTVSVNHFKSKGSGCGTGDDDPQQGNCNGTRTLAAEALVDWLATDPTNSGDPDFMIIGDLNAYDEEDPIDEIKAGSDDELGTADDFTDLVELYQGEFAYSYGFDGQFGYLDYALVNQPLLEQITGATDWHINSDEPDILDYDITFKQDAQDALYEPNPYRASDHDPVVVGLTLTPSVCAYEPTLPILKENGKPAKPEIKAKKGQKDFEGIVEHIKLKGFEDENKLVVVSKDPITVAPEDGKMYQANTAFEQGDALAEGVYVVQNDNLPDSDFMITDLEPETTYYVAVFIYTSGQDCGPNYLADIVASTTFETGKSKRQEAEDLISKLKDHILNVYPNPVQDIICVNVPSKTKQHIRIMLLDFWGNKMELGEYDLQEGDNKLSIDTQSLNLGKRLYLLYVAGQHQAYPLIRLSVE